MARKGDWADAAAELPQFFCSSDDFRRLLQQDRPDLLVPERDIVYLGTSDPAWGPDRERPHPPGVPCPDAARIGPGSLLCCPHCHLSGFEHRLADQLRLAGYPPAERPARATAGAAAQAARRAPAPAPPATADPKRLRWWRELSWSQTPALPRSARPPGRGRRTA